MGSPQRRPIFPTALHTRSRKQHSAGQWDMPQNGKLIKSMQRCQGFLCCHEGCHETERDRKGSTTIGNYSIFNSTDWFDDRNWTPFIESGAHTHTQPFLYYEQPIPLSDRITKSQRKNLWQTYHRFIYFPTLCRSDLRRRVRSFMGACYASSPICRSCLPIPILVC